MAWQALLIGGPRDHTVVSLDDSGCPRDILRFAHFEPTNWSLDVPPHEAIAFEHLDYRLDLSTVRLVDGTCVYRYIEPRIHEDTMAFSEALDERVRQEYGQWSASTQPPTAAPLTAAMVRETWERLQADRPGVHSHAHFSIDADGTVYQYHTMVGVHSHASESSYRYSRNDSDEFDIRPEDCWRCDAATATTDVGLCNPCHAALKEAS